MKHHYFILLFALTVTQSLIAQTVVNLSGYDGTALSVTTTATVNDEITIVFEDVDIVNNFYTEFQSSIFLFGGLETTSGTFQGSPMFSDLAAQPELMLDASDTDNAVGPNTYSITLTPALIYTSVADGSMVTGFNLLFQNQFSGGGNNQTLDLFIDLADAAKDAASLSNPIFQEAENNVSVVVGNKQLNITGNSKIHNISIYNILGQSVYKGRYNANEITIDLNSEKSGVYIAKVQGENISKTLKFILK